MVTLGKANTLASRRQAAELIRFEKDEEGNESYKFGISTAYEKEYGFGKLPDLILLDGGKGQVNAVLPLLKEFNLDIPVFGMVKDNKHRTSAISTSGGRIEFNSKRKAFSLVTQIQDEVHRFSVEYHRKKHTKSALENSLTQIKGIGEKKAKTLIVKFRTIVNIRNASVEELESVQGISKTDAVEIYKTFHGE